MNFVVVLEMDLKVDFEAVLEVDLKAFLKLLI